MRVQVDDNELAMVVEIALRTAPSYALKNLVSPTGKLDRQSAVEALSNRILSALVQFQNERLQCCTEPLTLIRFHGPLTKFRAFKLA